jgi:hypothetical protein
MWGRYVQPSGSTSVETDFLQASRQQKIDGGENQNRNAG